MFLTIVQLRMLVHFDKPEAMCFHPLFVRGPCLQSRRLVCVDFKRTPPCHFWACFWCVWGFYEFGGIRSRAWPLCRLGMNRTFCIARIRRCRHCGRAVICVSTSIFCVGSALSYEFGGIRSRAWPLCRLVMNRAFCGHTDTCNVVALLAADASNSSGYHRQRR